MVTCFNVRFSRRTLHCDVSGSIIYCEVESAVITELDKDKSVRIRFMSRRVDDIPETNSNSDGTTYKYSYIWPLSNGKRKIRPRAQ